MIHRVDVINTFVRMYQNCWYLEIGVDDGKCFENIQSFGKHGVDPDMTKYMPTHRMTSDEFFDKVNKDYRYDVIFIDGLHTCDQVVKDVLSASRFLRNKDSVILLHDCMPAAEAYQHHTRDSCIWYGDTWKGHAWIVKNFPSAYTLSDCDCGMGVIRGPIRSLMPSLEELHKLTWKDFESDSNALMRTITLNDYLERMKKYG